MPSVKDLRLSLCDVLQARVGCLLLRLRATRSCLSILGERRTWTYPSTSSTTIWMIRLITLHPYLLRNHLHPRAGGHQRSLRCLQ